MRHYALIGRTLTHSHSKLLFDMQGFSDADYRLQSMPSPERLREWVATESIAGFNVTNPYKQTVIPLLDKMSPEAHAIGAVNCVSVEGEHLTGHNTDAPAFLHTLRTLNSLGREAFSQAFILGTGGAAHAVAYALDRTGIPCSFVSRSPGYHANAIGYPQLSTLDLQLPTLIVNATPVGTYPDIDQSPLDLSALHTPLSSVFVYDLVYNPSPTLLLRQAAAAGAAICDGTAMLRRQAELSWDIWGLKK